MRILLCITCLDVSRIDENYDSPYPGTRQAINLTNPRWPTNGLSGIFLIGIAHEHLRCLPVPRNQSTCLSVTKCNPPASGELTCVMAFSDFDKAFWHSKNISVMGDLWLFDTISPVFRGLPRGSLPHL